MKTKNSLLVASMLFLMAFATPSCKKEKTKGCTINSASNYNPNAEENDGSCRYEGQQVLWYNQSTSAFLISDGATSLTYYVDGQIVGSTATSVYSNSAPSCGAGGSITITKNLGSSTSRAYSYSVKDQTGWEYWSGTLLFEANTCTKTQLN